MTITLELIDQEHGFSVDFGIQTEVMLMQDFKVQTTELALEKAAKMICTMKVGVCPIHEENFSGCHCTCHEEIRPWQCWVIHLKKIALN